jgi:hypothetical protein
MAMKDNNTPNDMPIVFSYSRAQAIADGVLVDLTEWARETGFQVPVACTSAVWHDYIEPKDGLRPVGQSERGRAHDVLWLLYVAIRKCPLHTDQVRFTVIFLMSPRKHVTVELKAISGPGDAGEPVLTIMLPHED